MPDYYSPPEVVAIMGTVDTYLRWRNTQEPPRGFEHYHPSAFGKCLRHMQYDRYVERKVIEVSPEEPSPNLIRIWETGHSMHDRWRHYFETLGVLRGVWQCKNAICMAYDNSGEFDSKPLEDFKENPEPWLRGRRRYGDNELLGVFKPQSCICGCTKFQYHESSVVSEELNFRGHCDGILDYSMFDPSRYMSVKQSYMPEYLPTKPVVVDFKSCNTFDFQDVANGNPHKYYLTQLTIYANILDCEYGLLLYENKNDSKTIAFRVDRNVDTVFAKIKKQANEMNAMVDRVDEEGNPIYLLPPPKPLNKEDKECRWCPYKEICHASWVWDNPSLRALQVEFYGSEAYESSK